MNNINIKCNANQFFLIGGPCVIENEQITYEVAEHLKNITTKHHIPFIFKASFKKENRTQLSSFTGPGIEKGLKILENIKKELGISITTDVHNIYDVKNIKDIIDIIQIPAFLCRQTDILIEAAESGKIINVKKGPFLSGSSCEFIIDKLKKSGNDNIIITERGNCFGYQDLIVDMRNIPIIKKYNTSVVLDVTHSNQKPNQTTGKSGGTPEFIETLACAGIAAGADGIFLETHPNPNEALSDGSNMLPLKDVEKLLIKLNKIKNAIS
jgi:2-dehydro-3-deoxyphosphooctonate aldolase (KDO 8-P synthase)